MKKVAHISAILENPSVTQKEFNEVVSSFKSVIKGRLGLPLDEYEVAVVSLVAIAEMDVINNLAGKLGKIKDVTITTAISKKDLEV